jgi:thiamine biosynthesis lipoprotein
VKRCRPALGTFVEISLPAVDETDAAAVEAIDRAFDAIRSVESCMSFHDIDSELTRLNRLAHLAPQQVSPSTCDVLAMARDVHARTRGLFDCAVGARLVDWKLLPDHEGAVGGGRSASATMADLELSDGGWVSYRRPMCLDLGGIAKGYAVDRAIEALKDRDIAAAVVNAGGDLRVLGHLAETIHVRDPSDPRRLLFAGSLSDGAIATSAIYWSACREDGESRSALVDPHAGCAVSDPRSFSVLAPTCMVADALTKAVALAGHRSVDFLAHYGAEALVLPVTAAA